MPRDSEYDDSSLEVDEINQLREIEDINKLREIEDINRLREEEDSFSDANKFLDKTGGVLAEGLRQTVDLLDRGLPWGAPLRSAVHAAQTDKPIGEAFLAPYRDKNYVAPTGKEIFSNMGMSEEEFQIPLKKNLSENYTVSPAGVVGGLAEGAIDPFAYTGLGAAKVVGKVAPRISRGLGHFAEERAVKAATGESIRGLKKLARVKGDSASDAKRALGNLRQSGRHMLETDQAGKPVVGWISNAQGIGDRAAAKRQFYGEKIGQVGETVEKITPRTIVGEGLANELRNYSQSIPNVGKGANLRKRLAEEADNFAALGPVTFQEAQMIKGQFPFEPQAADVLISDRDVTNKINQIISDKMDKAAGIKGQFSRLDLERTTVTPSEEDLAALAQYGPAKARYGTFKNVAEAGAEQGLRTLNRRIVSPSSHALGIGVALKAGADLKTGGLIGAGTAVANQVALSRGSAFAARSADALSRAIMKSPGVYQKWIPALQKAAAAGPAVMVQLHHQLMNNDPQYRALMADQEP